MKEIIGIDVGGSTTKIVAFRRGKMLTPQVVRAADPLTSLYGAFGKFTTENGIELSDILKAVQDGDVLAIECIGKIGETLGRGISGIINIFNPGLVIIGGRLIVGKDYLMLPIRTAVNRLSMERVASDTKIRLSTLGRKAIVLGNCLLARKKLLGI